MDASQDLNVTADILSVPPDSLDAGLAAGFGRPMAPRSSLGDLRPVLLKEAEGESEHIVKPKSDAMPPAEETGTRYQLSGEIARGGMGAVLRGRDVDLGRDLAVKVLLEKYANRPEVARRFVEEAQIGGQLQHPGVVPVYDIGRFGDRPFFTMKLVKGHTLAAILEDREDATADRPRLLGVALKVCETLAYAHAKGVIHRDLKPANIMVGAFGEVQVMDWGLAKVLAEGGIADEERASRAHREPEDGTQIRTARSTGSAGSFGTTTEMGSLLGTPAYMPPEQANGDIAHLDRRADVFGLGAILCEILTGKPPYVGRSGEEVRRKAANGDLADATTRLDACGADAELIALTKKCLSPEAIDRPKDAQEVTNGLSAYLNGVQERLQTAERERAVAVVREAEQRKKRKAQLALAAAVMVLLLGGGTFAFWRAEQAQAGRERDARNAEAVASLLGQAEEALKAGDAAKAEVVLGAAKKRSAEGGAEQDADRLKHLEADLALLRDLDAVDQFRWMVIENTLPDPAFVTERIREALKQYGADLDAMSVDEVAARASASMVRERVVSALDRLLRQQKKADVRDLLRRMDADSYRDAVRDAVLANDQAKMVELAGRKAALEQPLGFTVFMSESGVIAKDRRRELLQAAARRWPGDLSVLLALANTEQGDDKDGWKERLRWCQAAVAAAPENPAALFSLGTALSATGEPEIAIVCYQKAITLDPKLALAQFNLANELARAGQVDKAIAVYQKAIVHNANYFPLYVNLGIALVKKGRDDEAIECYRKAITLAPKNATVHYNLGVALARKDRGDEAIACYRKALDLDPKYALAHANLGIALRGKGQLDEAIACYRKAIELDPKYAIAHNNMGHALKAKGELDEAIACFRKAIALDPKYTLAHYNMGIALSAKGDQDEAIACYRKVIELEPKHALAHNNMGNALSAKGDLDGAISYYRKAIELDPKSAEAHRNLGIAVSAKGDLDEAISCYRKAIELNSSFAEAHCNLGHALAQQNRFAESLAAYKRGHELGKKQPRWRYPSAEWVRQAETIAALEAKLPAFLKGEFQPAENSERIVLAAVCKVKKLHATAAGLYAAAFAPDSKLADDLKAGHRYNAACSEALAAAGQGEDAGKLDDAAKAILRGQALDWLKADLALWTKQHETGKPADRLAVHKALSHWQKDPDLAGLRDAAALAKLPADEQKAFNQLWADVAALLKKSEAPATKEDKK